MHNQPSNTKKALVSAAALLAIVILFTAVTLNAKKSSSSQTTTTSSVAAASDNSADTTPTTSTTSTSTASTASYKDGTYTASSNYETPGGEEAIKVSITLAGNTVSKVSISQDSNNRESSEYQDRFASSYQSSVVGQKISDLNLSRVSGASLTTEGFNDAIQQIMNQATA